VNRFKLFANKVLDKTFGKDSDHDVPRKELIRFTLGVFGQNNSCGFIGWFNYFCLFVIKFEPMLFGTLFTIVRIWDAVNDPIVGAIIDKHTFKNGERLRPYIKKLAIPIGIMVIFLFIDFGLSETIYMLLLIAVYMVYDFLYSFQDIAQWGMTALISQNPKERARAAQIGRIGAMMGGWLPGIITLVIGVIERNNMDVRPAFVVMAVILGFGGMVLSYSASYAKERVPLAKKSTAKLSAFTILFKNKIVLLVVLGSILGSTTLVLQQITFFQYVLAENNIFGLEINGTTLSFIFGLLCGIPGSLCKPLAIYVARKLGGMRYILLASIFFNIGFRFLAFFIGYEGWRLVLSGLCLTLVNIPASMTDIAMTALWGDSLDYLEWKTGERNDGTVFSMQNASAKITGAISTFFMALTLTILQFDANLEQNQSPTFYKYAWPVFILAPMLGSILNLIPLLFIRYNDKTKELLIKELKRIRREREGLAPLDLEFKYELYDDDEFYEAKSLRW
jgi:Na+/melibiose symporter-like transporter